MSNMSNGGDKKAMRVVTVEALPTSVQLDLSKTALICIDFQTDFLLEGGFGDALGNDVTKVQRAIGPAKAVLDACRKEEILIIHTREGHRPQQKDITQHKRHQTDGCIGSPGKYGKILIRGEKGHDIVEELYPLLQSEVVLDKPGKGSFYATDLELILKAQSIETLLVCGVTTEVCVHTTVREANDRGFRCIVIEDACASYMEDFHEAAIKMVWAQGGIFGNVATSKQLVQGLLNSSE
eukprot:scaffold2811_cov102-Cylindrotheca_fusiformis.AAC.1